MELSFSLTDVKDIIELRHLVLRTGRPIETCNFSGDDKSDTFHFSAIAANQVVGCVSFMNAKHQSFNVDSSYQLRGMAVSNLHRGMKVGARLLSYAENVLLEKGLDFIWCNVREKAVPFYQKQSYKCHSDFFEIPEIGSHVVMYKFLKNEAKRIH